MVSLLLVSRRGGGGLLRDRISMVSLLDRDRCRDELRFDLLRLWITSSSTTVRPPKAEL